MHHKIPCFVRSQGLILEPKIGPKRTPNRIFDTEGVRKPLGSLLERSRSLSELKKTSLNRLLGGQEAHQDEISAHKGARDPGFQ